MPPSTTYTTYSLPESTITHPVLFLISYLPIPYPNPFYLIYYLSYEMVASSGLAIVPVAGAAQSAVTTFASDSTTLFQILDRDNAPKGYAWVELTALGNQALASACFTATQRQVWTWPSYEFLVKTKMEDGVQVPTIKVSQVRLSYEIFLL